MLHAFLQTIGAQERVDVRTAGAEVSSSPRRFRFNAAITRRTNIYCISCVLERSFLRLQGTSPATRGTAVSTIVRQLKLVQNAHFITVKDEWNARSS